MVRQKNRWLLVHFEFEPDVMANSKKRKLTSSSEDNASRNTETINAIQQVNASDIYRSLNQEMMQNFGLVGACISDVQVKLYDPKAQLAIIKTTRDKYPQVRSCLTFLTEIKQGVDTLKVVASTIAVSGCARTARNAAWEEVKKRFFVRDFSTAQMSTREIEKELQELEECLDQIDSGC